MNVNISTASQLYMERRTMIEEYYPACPSELLNELNALRIVLSLDLLVVRETCMFGRFFVVLEPSRVERYSALFTTKILDDNLAFLAPVVRVSLTCLRIDGGARIRLRTIFRFDEEREVCRRGGGLG